MSIQAAKEELNSLTEFQKDIHVTSNLSEEIISNFYKAFIKSTWYSTVPMKLKCSTDGDEVIYNVNNSFHFLIYSYMRFVTPPVSVKEEYRGKVRIAWCHNLGTNIVERAVFKEDDETFQTWDSVWADIYFQFYQSSGTGKRKAHNIGIGNVKCLEEWSEFLPSYPINVDQPWFYSMDPALAFPIFYKNSQTRIEHRYTLRRKVTDLLRIQVLDPVTNKWKDVNKNINKYIDVPTPFIEVPELWGRYAYITEKEIKWYKCHQTRSLYIRDIGICDAANPNKYKSTVEIDLQCTNPCLAIFWVAENRDATLFHNYSNYTTNTHDLYSGWNPIKKVTLKYGTVVKLDNMPSDHFYLAEPRKHFPSAPNETGYHGYSYAWDSTNFHGDIGIVFFGLNAKLQCYIDNNNLFNNCFYDQENQKATGESEEYRDKDEEDSSEEYKEIQTSPNFITRVRLLMIRKFTITADDNDKFKFIVK